MKAIRWKLTLIGQAIIIHFIIIKILAPHVWKCPAHFKPGDWSAADPPATVARVLRERGPRPGAVRRAPAPLRWAGGARGVGPPQRGRSGVQPLVVEAGVHRGDVSGRQGLDARRQNRQLTGKPPPDLCGLEEHATKTPLQYKQCTITIQTKHNYNTNNARLQYKHTINKTPLQYKQCMITNDYDSNNTRLW